MGQLANALQQMRANTQTNLKRLRSRLFASGMSITHVEQLLRIRNHGAIIYFDYLRVIAFCTGDGIEPSPAEISEPCLRDVDDVVTERKKKKSQ